MASTVSKFNEKPTKDIAAIAPNIEIGMVTSGTNAVLKLPIMASTTKPTNKTVSASVINISRNESRI